MPCLAPPVLERVSEESSGRMPKPFMLKPEVRSGRNLRSRETRLGVKEVLGGMMPWQLRRRKRRRKKRSVAAPMRRTVTAVTATIKCV